MDELEKAIAIQLDPTKVTEADLRAAQAYTAQGAAPHSALTFRCRRFWRQICIPHFSPLTHHLCGSRCLAGGVAILLREALLLAIAPGQVLLLASADRCSQEQVPASFCVALNLTFSGADAPPIGQQVCHSRPAREDRAARGPYQMDPRTPGAAPGRTSRYCLIVW